MGETNIIQIQIPNCSSNYQISKDIHSFLHKQGNHIPISLNKTKQSGGFELNIPFVGNLFNNTTKTTNTTTNNNTTTTTTKIKEEEEVKEEEVKEEEVKEEVQSKLTTNTNENNIIQLQFQNQTHTIDNIKGTKLYYLYLRNGECARWV